MLDAVGVRTVRAGDHGSAAATTRLEPAADNWVVAVTHAAGEALALARTLDVAPDGFLDLIDGNRPTWAGCGPRPR